MWPPLQKTGNFPFNNSYTLDIMHKSSSGAISSRLLKIGSVRLCVCVCVRERDGTCSLETKVQLHYLLF